MKAVQEYNKSISNRNWRVKDEVKKLGPLGLRLVEGLSGSALKVAQQIPTKVLASPEGAEELLGHLTQALKPCRTWMSTSSSQNRYLQSKRS